MDFDTYSISLFFTYQHKVRVSENNMTITPISTKAKKTFNPETLNKAVKIIQEDAFYLSEDIIRGQLNSASWIGKCKSKYSVGEIVDLWYCCCDCDIAA